MDKKDFGEIYAQWTLVHNEDDAISRRAAAAGPGGGNASEPTISSIRRMKAQDQLDLHNTTLESAIAQTNAFLERCWHRGLKKVRIITGKGLHSPNGESVIRPGVLAAVSAHPRVREYDKNPAAADGGSGAVLVILKRQPSE